MKHLTREEIEALARKGALDGAAGRAHLDECEACRHEYLFERSLRMAEKSAPAPDISAQFTRRLMAKISGGAAVDRAMNILRNVGLLLPMLLVLTAVYLALNLEMPQQEGRSGLTLPSLPTDLQKSLGAARDGAASFGTQLWKVASEGIAQIPLGTATMVLLSVLLLAAADRLFLRKLMRS